MLLGTWAFLLILAALLLVPVDLIFSAHRRESFRGQFSAGWMYGLVRIPMPSRRVPREERQPRLKKLRARLRFTRRITTTLRSAAFRHRLLKFAKELLQSLRLRDLEMRLRLGMDDPADTGYLWAFMSPAIGLLTLPAGTRIDVDLDFAEACLEFDATGTIRFIPAQLVFVALVFLLSPAFLRAAWTFARLRRK